MTQKLEHSRVYKVSPDALLTALISPEYNIAREKSQGALKAEYKEVSRTEARLVYEVHATNYARGMTGIDKSKTEDAHAVYTWDLKARRGEWKYHTTHGNRVQIWGSLRVQETGDGVRLSSDFNVTVKVPLMGKKIEKLIAKNVGDDWPNFDATLQRSLEA